MPPRFQKQHGQGGADGPSQSPQTPVSPQAGQPPMAHAGQTSPGMRHGPPHWYGDPRAWGGMPPPGYGPGRPMDMPGGKIKIPEGSACCKKLLNIISLVVPNYCWIYRNRITVEDLIYLHLLLRNYITVAWFWEYLMFISILPLPYTHLQCSGVEFSPSLPYRPPACVLCGHAGFFFFLHLEFVHGFQIFLS